MREWIDLVEKVVSRDRHDGTVIAINPTTSEWSASFPKGAGGVYCQNGDLVVGMGPVLAHDVILDRAGVAQEQEKYRLQLGPTQGYAEMWFSYEVMEVYEKAGSPTEKENVLRQAMLGRYQATEEDALREIESRTSRLAPGYQCRIVILNEYAECFREEDDAWRDGCF